MVHIYMSKEVLIEQAVNKLQAVMEKDFDTIPPRKKALLSMEFEDLYNRLAPFRSGSKVVGLVADDCLQMKQQLAMSEIKVPENAHSQLH